MNKKELSYKLNMIFDELLTIHEKIVELDMEKQRLKAKEIIEDGERQLQDLDYRSSRKWDDRAKRVKEFNYKFEE